MNKLVIMYCYARSGGTLFNKCLSSLPNNLVISEIHPDGGGFGTGGDPYLGTVRGQASEWYGIELRSDNYKDQILELYEYCNACNKTLILRDWIYLSYNSNKVYKNKPSYQFDTYNMFKGEVLLTTFALVRNAVDVWISMGRQDIDGFMQPYGSYLKDLLDLDIPWYRYEDFVKSPEKVMSEICDLTQLEYSNTFLTKFNNTKALGDSYVLDNYRGGKEKIQPQQRKPISPLEFIHFSRKKEAFKKVNSLFDYQTEYFNEEHLFNDYIKNFSSKIYKKFIKK